MSAPRAAIFGCAGTRLDDWERAFFAEQDPLGFILFARNVETPDQVRALVEALRETVGRRAPVLIDQEGGRVQRLRPPHWRAAPPPAVFGRLAERDAAAAARAVWLNARLIAAELADLGIDVDCLPCLDLRRPEGHAVIGDRAFSDRPEQVAALGRAACAGLVAGGVLPVIKHMPGHGRATVDSHLALPRVEAGRDALEASDFLPFRALADQPWGMTAHVVYAAVDPAQPATCSARVIAEVIRAGLGFDGLLLSDDLSMDALGGGLGARAAAALAAGCDVVLHCNGRREEMSAVAAATGALSEAAMRRLARGEAVRGAPAAPIDRAAARAELESLLG